MNNCEKYKLYQMDLVGEKEFQKHKENCSFCSALLAEDEDILKMAASLNKPLEMPDLWGKIEKQMVDQKQRKSIPFFSVFLKIAAVMLICVIVKISFFQQHDQSFSNIIKGSALQKVDNIEKEYLRAIADLEVSAMGEMAAMEIELSFLYKDKIETIERQISRCKEALQLNPGNVHIRQYFFAALKDKKNTLTEIMNYHKKGES